MYFTIGNSTILRNLCTIAVTGKSGKEGSLISDDRSLQQNLYAAVEKLTYWRGIDAPLFVNSEDDEIAMLGRYLEGTLDDRQQGKTIGQSYEIEVRIDLIQKTNKALQTIAALDPKLGSLMRCVLHSIFFRRSENKGFRSFGGSSSKGLGIVWFGNVGNCTAYDFIELLYHEFVHHVLFFDELTHGHFHYEQISNPANYSYSAILKKNRPIDKVVHSVVVATEVVALREQLIGHDNPVTVHPSTTSMRISTIRAIDELLIKPNLSELVQPRVQELLAVCNARLNTSQNIHATKELQYAFA